MTPEATRLGAPPRLWLWGSHGQSPAHKETKTPQPIDVKGSAPRVNTNNANRRGYNPRFAEPGTVAPLYKMERLQNALLQGIGTDDADAALRNIAEVLNAVEQHYDINKQSYDQGIYGSGQGSELIRFIEHEKKLQEYVNNKKFGDPT